MIKNMVIEELVHPDIYNKYKDKSWEFLNPKMLNIIEVLGSTFGRIVINNWKNGGKYKDSGLRTTFGSSGSAHRFGLGFDLKFLDTPNEKVYNYIVKHQELFYELGLRRVEDFKYTPTWLHIDGKPEPMKSNLNEIYFFKP